MSEQNEKRIITKNFTIELGQFQELEALSKETRVPMSAYIRDAIDLLLAQEKAKNPA